MISRDKNIPWIPNKEERDFIGHKIGTHGWDIQKTIKVTVKAHSRNTDGAINIAVGRKGEGLAAGWIKASFVQI